MIVLKKYYHIIYTNYFDKMVEILKTKTGRKYIKIKKKKLYLKSILSRINKRRKKDKKKLLKSITKRNLENALIELTFKGKKIKTKKFKRRRGRRPRMKKTIKFDRSKLEKRIKDLEDALKKEKDEKEKEQLKKTIKETMEALQAQQKLLLLQEKEEKEEKPKKKRGRPKKIKTDIKIEEIEDLDDVKMTREQIKEQKKQQKAFEKRMKEKEKEQEAEKKLKKEIQEAKDIPNPPISQIQEELETQRKQQEKKGVKDAPITEDIWKKLILGGMLVDSSKALNNFQIDDLMKRYKEYKGTYALDQVYKAIPLIDERTEGGLILNLDPSTKGGVHWCSLYWNGGGSKPQICYYDSFGRPPKDETIQDIKNIVKKLNSNRHMKLKINSKTNQDEDSISCGYLSCLFLMDMFRNGGNFKKATKFNVKQNEDRAEKMEKKMFRYIL